AQTSVLWSEDWEGNWVDNWHADHSVWDAGIPTTGPITAISGQNVAATNLTGNYPDNSDTRFIRHVSFTVPSASLNPRLRFWQWYRFSTADYGNVQISI